MKRRLFLIAVLALADPFGFGQAQDIVTVKVLLSAETVKVGQPAAVTLELMIRSPYHINSDRPLENFLIGTTVDFKALTGVSYRKVAFPSAEVRKLDLSPNPMAIFEGIVKITAEIVLSPDFKGRELTIEGAVGYQACDNSTCLPPTDAKFSRKVAVTGGAGGASKSASPFDDKSLLLTFLLVFLGGLALNLTPCIYPLIPITISYFGGQSHGKKGGVVAHSVIYVLGMAVTYSILGVIAAFTGSLFGAALQYPPVLVGIALIMIVLALSMFDVYELRVPAFLSRFAGGSQKGYSGSFFMGLTVGIIAAPCIGPFVLGLLTYVGNRGNVVLGFSLFFVLALGLGVPFLFLGIFSGSLNRIPRSGAWMVWVRTIFGFILIGMAIYFLQTLFPNALYYSLSLALTMLIAGIFMAWIEPTKSPGKVFPFVRNLFGVIFFVLALVVGANGIRDYLDEQVNAKIRTLASSGGGIVATDAIAWSPYAEEKLAAAVQAGKQVFIDFFTDWCIACKEMDRATFSDPEVIAATRDFVMLRSNLTRDTDPLIKDLYRRYHVRGVPTYVVLGSNGKEILEVRLVGFEPKKDFLPRLKRALELGKK